MNSGLTGASPRLFQFDFAVRHNALSVALNEFPVSIHPEHLLLHRAIW